MPASDGGEVARILAAEQAFREGEELMKRRAFSSAQRAFHQAVRLYPDEAEFHAWLGWSTWCSQPGGQGAEAEFEKALLCNPACSEALQELRLIHPDDLLGR